MKDLQELAFQCRAELASIKIACGKVKIWSINCRAKARWGLCKKLPDGSFEIEIAKALLQDDVSDIAVKNTIIHELLHTCPGCFKHTGRWKQYADRVNRFLPQYDIKRTTSAEEKGVAIRRKAPVYRYILKCAACGQEVKRQKKTAVIEHPEHYRCTCGGKLTRIQYGRGNVKNTKEILLNIADSIRETGNDPHDQLLGYISTGDATYITRSNNARALIQTVDISAVLQYVKDLEK